MSANRLFLHEHPLAASSWKLDCVKQLLTHRDVHRVRGDMCQHNMIIRDTIGPALAFKPTGWMSNSVIILSELNKLCTNDGGPDDHRHASLQNSRAAKAAVYPEKLCLAILRGLCKELIDRNKMFVGQIGTTCEEPEET